MGEKWKRHHQEMIELAEAAEMIADVMRLENAAPPMEKKVK